MTKREMFTKIATINATDKEIVDFCNHEIELLNKKSSGSRKPTAKQIENEQYKEVILEVLGESSTPLTISDIMLDSRLADLTNQRVSALITLLKNSNQVIRTENKKKAYFALAK